MKRKINYCQLVEILDGFGGIFLGSLSLLIKQQWEISKCLEKAKDISEFLYENNDGFETVNMNFSWEVKRKYIYLYYYSRSDSKYIFSFNLGFSFPYGDKCHCMEYPNDSALAKFIGQVSKSKGRHPNPLFRRK